MLANRTLTLVYLYLHFWSEGSGERQRIQGTSIPLDMVAIFSNTHVQMAMHFTIIISIITVLVPIAAHAPITAHQSYFQFEICGIINRPLKSSHTQWVPVMCQHYINFHLLTSGR